MAICFLQGNTKFYSCTQKTIRFFYNNTQNFEKLQPNGHSCF